jgi:hypothetical protein
VWPSDLAPDHPDVGAADLTLSTVNESDLLAKVEVGGLGVINTLNLDQARFHISDSVQFHFVCAGCRYLVLGVRACLLRW